MSNIQNDASKAGQRAAESEWYDDFEVYPVHSRFGSICWFVTDHKTLDERGSPTVVAQCDSQPEALAKFWPKYVARMNEAVVA